MASQCILIVEDEEAIARGLMDVFVFHGYEVQHAADGDSGLKQALSGRFDLIVLDVMLPGMDGCSILEAIREEDRNQPVIMLTARAGDTDIIEGLRLGADDYVSKPFSVAELVLRVGAVLRRSTAPEPDKNIEWGDLTIRSDNLCIADADGEEIQLTRREMDLLLYLHANADRAVPREELLSKVWGYDRHALIETRTIDIHIAKLRRKLERNPANPERIQTIRGAGYRLHTS